VRAQTLAQILRYPELLCTALARRLYFGKGMGLHGGLVSAWSCEGPTMWAQLRAERYRARLSGSVTRTQLHGPVRKLALCGSVPATEVVQRCAEGIVVQICVRANAAWICTAVTPVRSCAGTIMCAELLQHQKCTEGRSPLDLCNRRVLHCSLLHLWGLPIRPPLLWCPSQGSIRCCTSPKIAECK